MKILLLVFAINGIVMVVAKPAASREANLLNTILAMKKEGDDRKVQRKTEEAS